jgi:UrcA family protein
MLTKSTLIALTVALASVAHGASADTTETVSVKVRYGDLNLASQAGATEMLQRIHHAAKQACVPSSGDPLDRMYWYEPCVRKATNQAVAKLDSPIVTALNSGRGAPASQILASNR